MLRRSFLHTASLAMGSAMVVGCADREPARNTRPDPASDGVLGRPGEEAAFGAVGIQLYTLRDLMAQDVLGTLEQVATIGYREVEFAGYFDTAPSQLRRTLDSLALTAPSSHVDLSDLNGPGGPSLIDDAATIGHRYLIVAWLAESERGTLDHYKRHAATFNRLGERCREAGVTFGYHNHEFEFEPLDGERPYDVLIAETDPELVKLELDFFWARAAGANALRYLEEHPGRFELSHIKDMSADGSMVDVGDGVIQFERLIRAGSEGGMKHFFVEHDSPADPLATAARGYAHLVNLELS